MKNNLRKRPSNRRYLSRKCRKPDCQGEYTPTDARQIYCCEQHRIDFNNDKRRLKDNIDISFSKIVKNNRVILHKIASSDFYKKDLRVHKSLLVYEGYDFTKYHHILINQITKKEVHICYDYGLEMIESTNHYFSIKNTSDYDT